MPRLVNTLCDTAMLAAYGQNHDYVTLTDIHTSLSELRWQEPNSRGAAGHAAASHGAGAPGGMVADTARNHAFVEPVGRIIVATEGRTTQELPLAVGRIIIGRTSDNDLQVDSRFVSRHHCQIITAAEGSVIEDLNSTNGIFVQGKRVRRYNLNDGDIVVIGRHEIMYVDERLARARLHSTDAVSGIAPLLHPHESNPPDGNRYTETVAESSAEKLEQHEEGDKPPTGRAAFSAK